jgi:hypothetical protein
MQSPSPWLQWQHAQARAVRVNSDESTFDQFGLHLTKRNEHLAANHVRAHIVGSDLDDARLLALRRREDRAEIEIVRQHHKVVRHRVGHDFRVGRIDRAGIRGQVLNIPD